MKNPIANYREERGLTQVELGLFLGASQASVAQWETGGVRPTKETVEQLATIFQIQSEVLEKALEEFYEARKEEVRGKLTDTRG